MNGIVRKVATVSLFFFVLLVCISCDNQMHSVYENIVYSTCLKEGHYDEVVYNRKGMELSRITFTTPALGHDFQDGHCTRCGAGQNELPPIPLN